MSPLSYREEGDRTQRPVVLLHSVGSSTHLWDDVISQVSTHAHVVAVDLLGHGESEDPPRDLTLPEHADAVADLISDLGVGPVALVGCSLGALIALDLTARHGPLVSVLVLNGCPGWRLEEQRTSRLIAIAERLGPSGMPGPDFGLGGTTTEPRAEVAKQRYADLDRCGRWFLSSWWAMAAYDPMTRLGSISCPTRVVMGESDFHLATSPNLVNGIAGASLTVVPGAGHLTPFDDPTAMAAIILEAAGA